MQHHDDDETPRIAFATSGDELAALAAARKGYAQHLHLQQTRLGQATGEPQLRPVEWSSRFCDAIEPLGGEIVLVWRFCDLAMAWLETGPATPVAAGYLQWHASTNVEADELDGRWEALLTGTDEEVDDDGEALNPWARLSAALLELVVCGNFPAAGELLGVALRVVRHRGGITHEDDRAFVAVHDVVSGAAAGSPGDARRRQQAAENVLKEDRFILGNDGDADVAVFKKLLLDVATICTGDEKRLGELLDANGKDAMWYAAGYVALVNARATAADLHDALATFYDQYERVEEDEDEEDADEDEGDAELPLWYVCLESATAATRLEDFVSTAADVAAAVGAGADPMTRFAAQFMAAHLADVAAPAFAAAGAPQRALHARNRLVAAYATDALQSFGPAAWRVACMYLTFSPLADPAALAEALAAGGATSPVSGWAAVQRFHAEHLDAQSFTQKALRGHIRGRLSVDTGIERVFENTDLAMEKALAFAAHSGAADAVAGEKHAAAARAWANASQWRPLRKHIEGRMAAMKAESKAGARRGAPLVVDAGLAAIGEAVRSGFIQVEDAEEAAPALGMCARLSDVAPLTSSGAIAAAGADELQVALDSGVESVMRDTAVDDGTAALLIAALLDIAARPGVELGLEGRLRLQYRLAAVKLEKADDDADGVSEAVKRHLQLRMLQVMIQL
jgi:hypothetical protein